MMELQPLKESQMWQKPGLKTTWSKQTSVSPFLLEKPEVGRIVRPFRNQFLHSAGRPQDQR